MARLVMRLILPALSFLISWQPPGVAVAADDGALVDGILARAHALVSGRLEYQLTDRIPKRERTIHDSGFKLSLMGDSWARRNTGGPGFAVNHRGMKLIYNEGTGDDGQTRRGAAVSGPEALDRHRPCPPYFAGTLWYKNTIDFIDAHRAETTTQAGPAREGVATAIAEWRVERKDRRAFGPIPKSLTRGGTLRLHVAPALGYALPLVECVTTDGKVEKIFEAADFFEAAPGLFLPRRCEMRDVSRDGGYYVKYDITNADKINEEIPEDDFQIYLPPGTVVSDSRTAGGSTVFRVGEIPVLPNNLQDVIQLSPRDRTPWLRAALIGGAVGLALLAALALVRKLRGRQAREPR